MKRIFNTVSTVSIHTAVLLGALSAQSNCGSLSASITNLPAATDQGYGPNALNAAGQVTGYFFNNSLFSEAFLYNNGNLIDLGTLGGFISQGRAINSAGMVVGDAMTADGPSHAALFDGNNVFDLGTLGGSFSSAAAVNDAGQVIGTSYTTDDLTSEGFFYSNGSIVGMGAFGGSFSAPFALNNNGVAVGEYGDTNGNIRAFSYSGGVIHDLGTLGGQYGAALGINDAGLIVGESSVSSGDTHPFIYSGGVMTDLGTLGGTYAGGYFINQSNQVAGLATAADGSYHGFFFENGTMTDLGTFGGQNVFPSGLNDLGQVVGQADTASGDWRAFLWQKGSLVDLNTYLPANSGWVLNDALYINNAGRIVGSGQLNGVDQTFVIDLKLGNKTPVAAAGPNQTVNCGTQVTLDGTSSSDPDGDNLAFEWTSAGYVLGTNSTLTGYFALGTNLVTLKVSDPCGASSEAAVTVSVIDQTAPVITSAPGPVTVLVGNGCQGIVPNVLGGIVASDNCTAANQLVITQSPAAGSSVAKGQSAILVTVADSVGNHASTNVALNVVDQTAPVITSAPAQVTVAVGNGCQGIVPSVLGSIVAADNCTPANQLAFTQSPAAGTSVAKGQSTIVVTTTDASGNQTSVNVTLNVVDQTAPVITSAPAQVTVAAGNGCQGIVPNVLGSIVAADNCTPANQLVIAQSPAAGTSVAKGQSTIVVTATDASGNQTSANVTLNVVDQTAPVISSVPAPFTVAAGAACQGIVPNVLAGIVVTDNCTPANQLVMTQSPAAGTSLSKGQYAITVTVTDAAGNHSSASVGLSIVDQTAPVIQSASVNPNVLSPPNHAMIPVTVSVSATDNCDPAPVSKIVSITCNETVLSGEIVITGPLTANLAATRGSGSRIYTLTIRCTDNSGNSSETTVTVTVPQGNGKK